MCDPLGMNGAAAAAAGHQLNLLGGQNSAAMQQFAQHMQAKLAMELHSQQQQQQQQPNGSDRGDDTDDDDDDDRLSTKSDASRSRSPDNGSRGRGGGSGDENGASDGSGSPTPPPPASWSFGMSCNFCNKAFNTQPELLLHIKQHYLDQKQKDDKALDKAASEMTAAR